MMYRKSLLAITCMCLASFATAAVTVIKVPMNNTQTGVSVGFVLIKPTPAGLLFEPHLHNLTPGPHGFHIHAAASCADHGEAAGPHFDPDTTGRHLGPNGTGHLGDLPVLIVKADGTAVDAVLAPRIRDLSLVEHHSLMIHRAGDNYADQPSANGGGDGRMYCGVIE